MMHKRRKIGPYKHSINSTTLPANLIYQRLRLDLVFPNRDICLKYPELYEPQRLPPKCPRAEDAQSELNWYREYTDNLFYNRHTSRSIKVTKKFKKRYSQVIFDPAQVSLFYAIWKQLQSAQDPENAEEVDPEKRFFIIQGRIGSGKTIMLRHFEKFVFPTALKIDFPDYVPCMLFVDFQVGFSPSESISIKKIYKQLKKSLIQKFPDLGTKKARSLISEAEIAERQVDIELAEDSDLARREIIRETADNKVFVYRALRYLTKKRNCVVILVFDNADTHPAKNQLRVFYHLNEILADVSSVFGIVALRKYTLNDLGQLEGMRAYYDLKTMHMTTPIIPGILRRRFNLASDWLDINPPDSLPLPELAEGFEIVMKSYREFLNKWRKCLLDERTVIWMDDLANSNVRDIMLIVRALVSSHYINVPRIVSDFYTNVKLYKVERWGPPWTKKVSSEEFLRLLMLGTINEHSVDIYKDTPESLVQNIFDFNGEVPPGPTSLSGRFPILLKYRAMNYFGTAKRRKKSVFLDYFSIYGYTQDELTELLQWFINYYFVESKEGTDVSRVKWIFATPKLRFYLHRLSKFLIYLENIRNDNYLTYHNPLHKYETSLRDDIWELLYFYLEIMKYECQEYAFMKKHKQKSKYSSLVGRQPVCWRLLKSCRNRMIQLRSYISKWHRAEIERVINGFNEVRYEILKKCHNDELLPQMTKEVRDRCRRLKVGQFLYGENNY